MRLGLISDVHGTVEAMNLAIAALVPQVDEILLAGDVMHEYRWCNEVVETARELRLRYVLGNHELSILSPLGERARAGPTVRASNVAFLRTVPTRLDVELGGKRLTMVHATPWAPYTDYLHPRSPLLARCADPGVDILVTGHTHVPLAVRVGPTLVVNPGSLGESREAGHRGTVSYATLDTDSDEVVVVRMPNPQLPPL
jgi:putative phosphoesterase